MKREVSAAEAVLIIVFCYAAWLGMGVLQADLATLAAGLVAGAVIESPLTVVHELGHAVVAVHVTGRRAHVRVGQPPFTRRFALGMIDVEYSQRGYMGHCEFGRSVPITGRGLLTIALAGPAANLAIGALVGYLAYLSWDASPLVVWPLLVTAGSSVFVGLANLIPQKDLPPWWPGALEGDHRLSDGYVALMALKAGLGKTVMSPPPPKLFSDRALRALAAAGATARAQRHSEVRTDDLLLGLFDVDDGPAVQVLRDCGFRPPSYANDGPDLEPVFTPAVKRALERARTVLTLRGDQLIDTEHMLLGLIEEPNSLAGEALASRGVDRTQVRRRLLEALAS